MIDHGFTIAGEVCPEVSVGEFTMGERAVLFEYSGIVLEDFRRVEGETDEARAERIETAVRNPGYITALLHIAYARRHPEMTRAAVQKVAEAVVLSDALLTVEGDDDANPPNGPESMSTPATSSETRNGEKASTSGHVSVTSSGQQDADPRATGGMRSGTWHRYDRVT